MARAPWEDDPRLDRSWREWRALAIGLVFTVAFLLLLCFAGAADLPR